MRLQKLTETVQAMHKTMEEFSKHMSIIKESNDKMSPSLLNNDG